MRFNEKTTIQELDAWLRENSLEVNCKVCPGYYRATIEVSGRGVWGRELYVGEGETLHAALSEAVRLVNVAS